MNNEIKQAYAEVYEILQLLNEKFASKLPKKLIEFIELEKDNEYEVNINPNIPLEEQNLLPDTINLLAMLKLDYWCDTEEEREELLGILNENEEEYQTQLRKQYNPDNLFKNKLEKQSVKEEISLVPMKEKNLIVKLLEKIKAIFTKNTSK